MANMHAFAIKAIMQFYSDLAANIKVAVMSFCRVATRALSDQSPLARSQTKVGALFDQLE